MASADTSKGSNDGDVPEPVCHVDAAFPRPSSVARCEVSTIVHGNVLGGSFALDSSASLPFDVSAEAMAAELSGLFGLGGAVAVTRTAASARRGYTWLVTFTGATGNVPLLAATSSLTGAG
ncbi:MAG: hypothetical protein AAFU61_18230, partial [Pseudomonadota bacterium]